MKIEGTPTGDRVLIKADKPKDTTASGILIKEDWKTLPLWGVVVSAGPDTEVKPGERVMFERYASIKVDEDHRLCKMSHIFMKVEP